MQLSEFTQYLNEKTIYKQTQFTSKKFYHTMI